MNRFLYTKMLMQNAALPINSDDEIIKKEFEIWVNHRSDSQSYRLTDAGLEFLMSDLDLTSYEIDFPKDLDLKPQVLLYLDKFFDSPYFLGNTTITVFSERKMIELVMFSGDVRQYGLAKAMSREYSKEDLNND